MPYKTMVLRVLTFLTLVSFCLEASTDAKGLAYLNTIRANAGLIKFKHNPALQKAASAHAKYLILNQVYGHYEKSVSIAYTGSTPAERVVKAGYPSTFVMENLSINPIDQKKSIDTLFSAIYHRFVFLNFDKDEIGIGSYDSKKKRRKNSAYVYNLGSEAISKLCSQTFIMQSGKYYMKKVCKDSDKMIPQSLFRKKKDMVRRKNRDIVLYPYAEQNNIWPAFYNEAPDPLPYYDVSGFPVSVQFNPVNYKNVQLKSFRLYDASGKELKKTKILQHNNDHNHLFTKLQFALMPLTRLDFSQSYTAEFKAVADGKQIQKRWTFRTTELKEKVYTVTEDRTEITLTAGTSIVLYIVPGSKKNIVRSYRTIGKIKVSFLDQNTLKITAPSRATSRKISLDFGRRKVFFTIK
jgi:hypothetical protein